MSIARLVLVCVAFFAATATPALAAGTLSVSVSGPGRVVGSGIDCSRALGGSVTGDCSEDYANVRECIDGPIRPICLLVPPFVGVTAGAGAPGFAFDGWTGDCAGFGASCSLEMDADYRATAVFKDVQDPSVTLTNPGALLRGGVTLIASASDNAGIARVDFTLAGVTVSDSAAPYSAGFDTAVMKDGATQAKAVAVDTSGRTKEHAIAVTLDDTAPTAQVDGPNGVTFVPGATPAWTIQASDATSGVKTVTCSLVATGAPASFSPCPAGGFTAPVKGDGAYVFTTRVTDFAGNVAEVVRTYAIDGIAPLSSVLSGVADGATTSETSLTWAFESEPGASFACRVYPAALTPGPFAPCSAAGSHTAAGFAPGVYAFEVQATDAAGNVEVGSVRRTFTVAPAPAGGGSSLNAAAKSAPQIRVNVTFTFKNSTKKQTTLTSLMVRGVPTGATVSAKGFKKTNAKGDVSLKKLLKKPFKAGSTITITVSKPGMGTAIKTLKILPRKTPTVSTKCQAPGATNATAC
ncbi:Ig-like domain-containing protein [Solirubrobacter taibaiensis]|nr:Ig-like domain-containing protein [Solirubrobacter taibaiensis]